ncbi:hypothetical protein [Motiliproteus sp. MSK22-1]|uniref:hypothetical protein n=1 Tax=Motiliproteus sp. MSK22-1 TaxID=1897630 RepID=UPI00097787E7|nr:hypothetical protein [Motiliproteus sp. MSK22-1]
MAPFGDELRLYTGKSYYAVWPSHAGRHGVKGEFLDWLVSQDRTCRSVGQISATPSVLSND